MVGSLLGTEVVRVEDPELLQGRGTYVDNLAIEGVLHLVFVRSPFAHAEINSIDTAEAGKAPGVVAVYTAEDLGLPAHHGLMVLNDKTPRPPLATDRVRFVGDPVAVVIAETRAAAVDAAELVDVDYEPLDAVTDAEAALAPGAPLQFPELGSNITAGAREADGYDPLAGADVVVRGRFVNQRMAVVPMEGNAVAVVPGTDPAVTVYVSTQMPHGLRDGAAKVLGLAQDDIRVVAPHVGGGFGAKAGLAHEHTVVIASARRLGRPVKWVETRSENLTSMPHGRGQVQYIELGFTRDGDIVGMRCRVIGDSGAYSGFGGALPIGPTRTMAQGVYRIPKIGYDVATALTNTTPMGAFRGAGRPEAAAFLERIMDLAADELDIDPAELRRRNLLRPEQFPYTTATGTEYDSGDYARPLDEALRRSDYAGLRAEQAARRARGDVKQLGIGVAVYVEITGGGAGGEYGAVEVHDDGTATIKVGTSAHGQGHATSFAMLVSDVLGIDLAKIKFVQSDTAAVPRGGGTGGSRSLQLGGSAVQGAATSVLDKARELAASLLEADPADVTVTEDGQGLGVSGVPTASVSWAQLATRSQEQGEPLAATLDFTSGGATFPFGAHVSVVEVDTETGLVTPIRHVAVDDCGRIVNPLLVHGQQHGGAAQGIAQALWEEYRYDEDGNPITSSLAEYTIPTAVEMLNVETYNTVTPTPRNPLGAKGIGESATVGSTPAVQNAVVDALSHLGVRHIDLPCTPQRVWEAINGQGPELWREPPAALATVPVRAAGAPASNDPDI